MSRHNPRAKNGVKLPFAIRQELGLPDPPQSRDNGRGRGGGGYRGGSPSRANSRGRGSRIANRRQQRQASRIEKGSGGLKHNHNAHNDRRKEIDERDEDAAEDNEAAVQEIPQRLRSKPKTQSRESEAISLEEESDLDLEDEGVVSSLEEGFHSDSDLLRAASPGLVLDATSRAFRDGAAEDDAEIEALERRLGMRKKKTAKMNDEMLDYLLDGLESDSGSSKRKREEKEWLASKRKKIDTAFKHPANGSNKGTLSESEADPQLDDATEESESEDLDDDLEGDEDIDDLLSEDDESHGGLTEEDDFADFDVEDDEVQEAPVKKVRENPYVAPVVAGSTTAKYVPPSLRRRNEDGDMLERLKKQVQGQLNKLSEANLVFILGEIERLYRTNPRREVTTALIDLILLTLSNPSSLQNTFIILYAAFTTAIYKVMGNDFGAELLCRLLECFDEKHRANLPGKEALNLMGLLANLFTFGFVSSTIVYDHIQLLLSDFNESNTELLLRIIRDCGPQLRSDDPSALKGVVQTMHQISADMSREGKKPNVRTQVMMDTITDLKNNKIKHTTNATGATGEHITRMRKALGSLNNRPLKATEPLRISRADIQNSDKRGKWWLVGASWKGNESKPEVPKGIAGKPDARESDRAISDDEVDFLALAKQYRMNTDVRRSIFVATMSASDCRDAQMRMLKLRLTNKQEQEIAKVLLRCARAESVYNPYYALLARNLCKENRKVRVGFQFGLWDFFNRMGERADEEADDEDEDVQDSVEMYEIVNVAKMFAYLISYNYLTLSVLKILNIGFLKEQATAFLEILLITIMTEPKTDESDLIKIFGRTADTPHMVKNLQYFIKKNVRKSDMIPKKEKARVKEACKIADVALSMAQTAGADAASP